MDKLENSEELENKFMKSLINNKRMKSLENNLDELNYRKMKELIIYVL